jgi:hypothetical protein
MFAPPCVCNQYFKHAGNITSLLQKFNILVPLKYKYYATEVINHHHCFTGTGECGGSGDGQISGLHHLASVTCTPRVQGT